MILFVLSIIMLIVLALAVYAMTRGDAIEQEITRLVETKPVEQIYDEYLTNARVLNLFVAGGILLTGAFSLIFFGAGGVDPRLWSFTNYLFAIIGLTATVAITLGQRSLYSNIRQNLAALAVTLLILSFVIFSEVATSSEREDAIVRDRSLQSPTLSAVIDKIGQPQQMPASSEKYYLSEAARYQSLADNCTGACKRANQARADSYRERAQFEASRVQQQINMNREAKRDLIDSASQLEYVESNHTAIVRWLKEVSASTWTAAMVFASLMFVVAFESGFHFTGTKNGIYIEALSRLGYSVRKRTRTPTLLHGQNDAAKRVTRTNTDTYTDNADSPRKPEKVRVTDNLAHTDNTDDIENMKLFYEVAKAAKAGDTVCCPYCAAQFEKRTYNQCFCSKDCKDNYHNTIKPERLQVARGAI